MSSSPTTRRRTLPLAARLVLVGLLLAVAALLTTSAYTRDNAQWVGYTCSDGDRFALEYQTDHVRLRHGSGIFALTAEKNHDDTVLETYTDGRLLLLEHDGHVILERPAVGMRHECIAEVAAT